MKKNGSETDFKTQMLRMYHVWPADSSRQTGLNFEFRRTYHRVGLARFTSAVERIVESREFSTFPTLAEFNGYVPADEQVLKHYCSLCEGSGWVQHERKDSMGNSQVQRCPNFDNSDYMKREDYHGVTPAMVRDREEHPENWFGWRECKAYMFLRGEYPKLTPDEVWALIDEYRQKGWEAMDAIEAKRGEGGLTEVKHIMFGGARGGGKKAALDAAWKKWNDDHPAPPTIQAKPENPDSDW